MDNRSGGVLDNGNVTQIPTLYFIRLNDSRAPGKMQGLLSALSLGRALRCILWIICFRMELYI